MTDKLLNAIENLKQTGNQKEFSKSLSTNLVYIFTPASQTENKADFINSFHISSRINGQPISLIPFFSNQQNAQYSLELYLERLSVHMLTELPKLKVTEVNGISLFQYAIDHGLPAYYNPFNQLSSEKKFFSIDESVAILNFCLAKPEQEEEIKDPKTKKAFNFNRFNFKEPKTTEELAEIFESKPEKIKEQISKLIASGILEIEPTLDDQPEKLYDPIITFYLGLFKNSSQGKKFRLWFNTFMTRNYFARSNLITELMELNKENSQLKNNLAIAVISSHKAKKESLKIKNKLKENTDHYRLALEDLTAKFIGVSSEKQKDNRKISMLYEDIVELENDLRMSEEWIYPRTLDEVLEAGAKLYSSKLILAKTRPTTQLSDELLGTDTAFIAETIKIIKSLALSLHPMKFKYGNYSEDRFIKETGLELSFSDKPENIMYQPSTEPQNCIHNGIQHNCTAFVGSYVNTHQIRLYFQFIAEDRKILLSHLSAQIQPAQLNLMSLTRNPLNTLISKSN